MRTGTMARPMVPSTLPGPACRPTVTEDDSYRHILGSDAWVRLRPEVRARFSKKPRRGMPIRYEGTMAIVELSFMGWLFAQACRLIGTPLAPYQGTHIPMSIELTPDEELHGVAWHRSYYFPNKAKFTVRSTKCKGVGNEFIEHIGCGFRMRLELSEKDGGLVFTSVAYEIRIAGFLLRLPSLLTPGVTTVTHSQKTGDRFQFSLSTIHPFLGRTIFQTGEFYSIVSDR